MYRVWPKHSNFVTWTPPTTAVRSRWCVFVEMNGNGLQSISVWRRLFESIPEASSTKILHFFLQKSSQAIHSETASKRSSDPSVNQNGMHFFHIYFNKLNLFIQKQRPVSSLLPRSYSIASKKLLMNEKSTNSSCSTSLCPQKIKIVRHFTSKRIFRCFPQSLPFGSKLLRLIFWSLFRPNFEPI